MKLAGGRCHLLALCDRHHKLEFASAFGGLPDTGRWIAPIIWTLFSADLVASLAMCRRRHNQRKSSRCVNSKPPRSSIPLAQCSRG
jgi:uncharacterized membrane protein YtjA (UPF0391 family)